MKFKCLFILVNFIVISITSFSQVPNSFKYQSIIRSTDGSALSNQAVMVKISILKSSASGISVYSEIHVATANSFGIINFNIGEGTNKSGSISTIDWSADSYFIKIEMDETGGTNFTLSSVSQLLSVPYSLSTNSVDWSKVRNKPKFNEGSIPAITTNQRDTLKDLYSGLIIFNISTNCLNYYNGTNWFENCGSCTPQPTKAFAGYDLIDILTQSITLSANTPEVGTGSWSIVKGLGGSFDDYTNAKAQFTGTLGVDYVLNWSISNSCSSNSDSVSVSFKPLIVKDYEGHEYRTVKIGDQIWMKDNLKTKHYSDGTALNLSEVYPYYSADTIYGFSYSWNVAMHGSIIESSQGVCPIGWHIPSESDYNTLISYLGGKSVAGGKLKEVGTDHWLSPNAKATDEVGFSGLPTPNIFGNNAGVYFSSTEFGTESAKTLYIEYDYPWASISNWGKPYKCSIRCLKD
jgi:uncharacterized protein (TIGR02145 family)